MTAPAYKRRRFCDACVQKTAHLRLGKWASPDRCHRCRICGHLVDHGELVQIPEVGGKNTQMTHVRGTKTRGQPGQLGQGKPRGAQPAGAKYVSGGLSEEVTGMHDECELCRGPGPLAGRLWEDGVLQVCEACND